jgi:glycerol-3-phosphate acyltransferase PlsY
MKYCVKGLVGFQGVWSGGAKIGTKSTILGHFLGIFGIFRGGKGSLDGKYGKIIYFNILYTHQARQIWFSEVFLEVHSLGDSQFG